MLVLSRKTGERIHIGEDVFVEVRRVSGNRVTLAVCAPRDVRILRGELMESADAFDVLDEPAIDQSAQDTVIMKHEAEPQSNEVPTSPIIRRTEPAHKIHAK